MLGGPDRTHCLLIWNLVSVPLSTQLEVFQYRQHTGVAGLRANIW